MPRVTPTRGRARRPLLIMCLVGVALALTACGTTVPLSTSGTGQPAGAGLSLATGDGVSPPGSAGAAEAFEGGSTIPGTTSSGGQGAGSAPATGSAPTGGAPTGGAPTGLGSISQNGGVGGPGPASADAPLEHSPGVTSTAITVGIEYIPDSNQAAAQFGVGDAVAAPDGKQVSSAIIKDINALGGVAGRQLTALYHETSAFSGESTAARNQAACEYYTRDHAIFATLDTGDETFRACMAKAGVVQSIATLASLTRPEQQRYPLIYDVGGITLDRLADNLVRVLVRDNYFTGWNADAGAPSNAPAKLGVLVPDHAPYVYVTEKVLLPALARAGIRVDSGNVYRWAYPEDPSQSSTAAASIAGAVLRFKGQGVTHVIPLELNSLAFFSGPAEQQQYRPRYGLSTPNGPQAFVGTLIPERQLVGSMGFGWNATVDLPASADKRAYAGPGRDRCLKVMADAGITFQSTNGEATALIYCDALYSLARAINDVPETSAITGPTALAQVEALGTSFEIAGLPQARFAPDQHDAVTTGHRYSWSTDCSCMVYTGPGFDLT